MIEAAYAAFGRLDIIVANAGGNVKKPIVETSLDEFRQNIDLNFWGTVYPVLEALRGSSKRTMDESCSRPRPPACSAKRIMSPMLQQARLVGFARALAVEIGKRNVKVNLISPYALRRDPGMQLATGLEAIMSPTGSLPWSDGWLMKVVSIRHRPVGRRRQSTASRRGGRTDPGNYG